MLRAPRFATFPKATCVPGLIDVERRSAASRILKTREDRLVGCEELRPQADVGKLSHPPPKSALFGYETLSIGLQFYEPQYKGVEALYFGAARV